MGSKKAKKRPGPVGRVRTAFAVRIDPALAGWLEELAASKGLSRNDVVERWLSSLMRQSVALAEWVSDDKESVPDARWLTNAFGSMLARDALELGVLPEVINRVELAAGDEYAAQQNRALQAMAARDHAEGERKRREEGGAK
jgi:hypothetical protein